MVEKKCIVCGYRQAGLDYHHIIPLKDWGHPTDEKNLAWLCPIHHDEAHSDNSFNIRNNLIGLFMPLKDVNEIKGISEGLVKLTWKYNAIIRRLEKYGLTVKDAIEISMGKGSTLRKVNL